MSIAVMRVCWSLQVPPTSKAVLISLADNANDQGECWPSIPTICERTCFSERAVHGAIKWLEDAGVLKADRSNGRKTRYVVVPDDFKPPQELHHRSKCAAASNAGKPPQEMQEPPQMQQSPPQEMRSNYQEPSITPKKSNSQRRSSVDTTGTRFDEFWSVYPVKTEKRQCAAKWIAEALDAHVDLILADIAAKSDKDRRWLEGYIPNALTYLNQERWNDPVQPANRRPSVTDHFTQSRYESSSDEELPESLRSPA
jgi:hypothetical protein